MLGYLGEKKRCKVYGLIKELTEKFDIYFVNYKNSMLGVGGVGTVTRALLKILPNLNMVCYDPNYKISEGDSNIGNVYTVDLETTEAELFHGIYAKLYLWPVLHNTFSVLKESEIADARVAFLNCSRCFAEKTVEVSKSDKNSVYWINDYNLACVAGFIREKNPESKIIFSLRTPFGVSTYPDFFEKDAKILVEGMLSADLLTFHREKDVLHFFDFVERHFDKDPRVEINWKNHTLFFNKRLVVPRAFVMGNEPDYRKALAKIDESTEIKNNFMGMTKGVVITSVSRFDETKGVNFELDCIESLLKHYPHLAEKFTFLRISYLSERKRNTPSYITSYNNVVERIRRINKKYGNSDWQPIIGKFDQKLNDLQMTGLFRATDILLIGSLGDGFNHIALEAAISKIKNDSPLRLVTTNVGATDYLEGYDLIDVNDVTTSARILYDVINIDPRMVKLKYKKLRKSASKLYAYNWALSIFQASVDISKVPILTKLIK